MEKVIAAPEAFQAAAAAYAQGRLEDAARLLTALCAQCPQDVSALHLLSIVHMGREDWPQAANYARRVLTLDAAENIPRKLAAAAVLLLAAANGATQAGVESEYAAVRPLMLAALARAEASAKAARDLFYSAMLAILCADDAETGMRWLALLYPGAVGLPGRGAISPFRTVKDYCVRTGIPFFEIAPTQKISIANGAISRTYDTDPLAVAAIPGGEAVCGWDFAMTPSGEILADSGYTPLQTPQAGWFPHAGVSELPKALHIWPEQVTAVDADVLFLHAPSRLHIGHWLVDFLPRLRALARLDMPDIRICVPAKIGAKHRELLSLFGVKDNQLIECRLGARYKFRRLVVVKSGDPNRPSPEYLDFLERALPRPAAAAQRSRRIFLIRAMPTRKITNAGEIRALLDTYGFEYVDLSALGIAAQRDIFAQADLVIGTYGSDLLSMFFMAPGSDLVELKYDVALIGTGEEAMSAYLRVNMHTLLCAPAPANRPPTQKKDADFSVDCTELRNLLEAILARKAAGIAFQTPLAFRAAAG